jgi:hypothetical protein
MLEEGDIRVLRALSVRAHLLCLGSLLALWAAPARAQHGTLRGAVRDSVGAPIANADVGIVALRRLTRTDEQGRFEFSKVPHGKTELSVRRLSYEPRTVNVVVAADPGDSLFIVTLLAHPAFLNAVNVTKGEVRQREMIEDYYRRVTRGVGQYITRGDIEKRWGGTPSDLLRSTPGVRMVRVASGKGIRFPTTSINRRDCAPMIWVDGQRAPGMEIDDITLGDIEGIELYSGPSTTPMQFSQAQGANSCGTIVIWSRPPQYQKRPQQSTERQP